MHTYFLINYLVYLDEKELSTALDDFVRYTDYPSLPFISMLF